jgi:hypothetical protein
MPPSDADILEVDAIGARALAAGGIDAAAPQRVVELIGLGITAEDAADYLARYCTEMKGRRKPTPFNLFLVPYLCDKLRDDYGICSKIKTSNTIGVDESARISPVPVKTNMDTLPEVRTTTARRREVVEDATTPPADIEEDEVYRTSDLYLAAYIVSSQRRLLRTERDGKRVTFVFPREARILRAGWLDMSATTNVVSYATAIKNLKQMIASDS